MSRAAKRSRLERIVRCALGWGVGRVLDDSRRRVSAAAYVSAGADCSPCGYRDPLSKPTSGIVGSRKGFTEEGDELVGIQRGFAGRTWQIRSRNSQVCTQEVQLAEKVTTCAILLAALYLRTVLRI